MKLYVRLFRELLLGCILGTLILFILSCAKSSNTDATESPQIELGVPKDITIEPNITSVKLSWATVSGVDGYNLELASNSAFTSVLSTINIGVQTSYTFDNLTQATRNITFVSEQ